MTISSPASPYGPLSQPAVKTEVRIGANGGARPTAKDVSWDWFPVTAHLTATGRRDDVLELQTLQFNALVDCSLLKLSEDDVFNRQVEVWALDEDGRPSTIVTWGMAVRRPVLIDDKSEIYSMEARIGDEHFGTRFDGYHVFDPVEGIAREIIDAVQFNPQIDAIIEPNKSSKTDDEKEWNYILHPESIRTGASRALQAQTASFWKLADAVLALCWWINPNETYIKNPKRADVDASFAARNELLKNVTIPLGTSLPDALDMLLGPLEYGWHLRHSVDKDKNRETTIRFYERGSGPKKNLLMQRPAAVSETVQNRDIKKTQVLSFDALTSIIDLANRVICYGEVEKREVTINLVKAWDPSFDSKHLYQLREGSDFAKEHPEVGRKWVVDTAGDYVDLRPELTEPADLSAISTSAPLMLRRRKFERCLSQHEDADDREANQVLVEWYNETAPDAADPDDKFDPGWKKVKWPFSVLEKEAGIVFDGETPPVQLWSLIHGGTPEKARVRITATLSGDRRVKGDAVRLASSPNKLDVVLTLDVSDKFQDSRVESSGEYQSVFWDSPTSARNDTSAIQQYAEQIRTAEDALRLDTSIPLEGLNHPEYQIGDVLPLVKGRNISLDLATNRWPQIVGIVHHFQSQSVELLLESFRKERPRVVLSNNSREVVAPQQAAAPQTRKQIYGKV